MDNSIQKILYLLSIIDKAKQPVGKTYIQKGLYLLQEGFGEDLGFSYKIHFYGPYSQELSNLEDVLDDYKMIDVEYIDENKGYKVTLKPNGKRLLDSQEDEYNIDMDKIEKVSSLISSAKVKDLELLSTVLYFSKLMNDRNAIIKKVLTLKPHFNKNQIKETIKKLEEAEILKF